MYASEKMIIAHLQMRFPMKSSNSASMITAMPCAAGITGCKTSS